MDLPTCADAVNKPGLYAGFLGLLGALSVDAETMTQWLPDWQAAYAALPENGRPIRLHPYRWFYYQKAVEVADGYGEKVTDPNDVLPALERGLRVVNVEKRQAVINVLCSA